MSGDSGAPGGGGFDFGRTGGVKFSSSGEGGVPSEFFKMFEMGGIRGMGGDGFESFFDESGMGSMGGAKGTRTQKFKFTSKAR
jgi:hypothetical protein